MKQGAGFRGQGSAANCGELWISDGGLRIVQSTIYNPKSAIQSMSRGFSALEVLVAATVIALALLAIASMFPTGYQDIHLGGGLTIATELAQRKLEELRNRTFTSLATLHTTATPPDSPASVSESSITVSGMSAYSFMRNTWVNVEGTSPYRTAKITVIVSWGEGPLGTREVKLESRVAE